MRVRVRLVGDGTEGNPFRAPLPTYTLLSLDPDAGWVIVEIPELDHPFGDLPSDLSTIEDVDTPHGLAVAKASPEDHAEWHEHLDARYVEHKGKFRPEIV